DVGQSACRTDGELRGLLHRFLALGRMGCGHRCHRLRHHRLPLSLEEGRPDRPHRRPRPRDEDRRYRPGQEGGPLMSTSAVVMLIVSIVLLWGGLAAALVHLWRHPEEPELD